MTKSRNVVIGVAAGVVALLLVGLLAGWLWSQNGYGMMGGRGFPWHMDGWWGMHTFDGMHTFGGAIWMLVLWALVLGGGAWLVAWLARQPRSETQPAGRPLDIARQRYARGEIDRQEFERIRDTLRS